MNIFERLKSTPQLTGPKRQHFVPRFYLEQFVSGEALAVFDRTTGSIRWQVPDDTAVIGHLYTFEDHQDVIVRPLPATVNRPLA